MLHNKHIIFLKSVACVQDRGTKIEAGEQFWTTSRTQEIV